VLFDRVFGGETPMLTIDAFKSMSEMSEQKGFVNLRKGTARETRTVARLRKA
jgi:hypothetical protein